MKLQQMQVLLANVGNIGLEIIESLDKFNHSLETTN
jgi:hypothetical protein